MTVQQVAKRFNRSVGWARDYFSGVPGVLKIPGKNRTYLRIPVEVFDREWRKFQGSSRKGPVK